MKPVQELLRNVITLAKAWADPFAGENSPAELHQ